MKLKIEYVYLLSIMLFYLEIYEVVYLFSTDLLQPNKTSVIKLNIR
jgi:hypothetical protein